MRQMEIENEITKLLSQLATQVKFSGAMNRNDINRVAQNLMVPLLAEVCGYKNLRDLDLEQHADFPGIDLGDDEQRVAIQVTSTTRIEKVKHTIRQFRKYSLYEKYDRLIVYMLVDRQNSYSQASLDDLVGGIFKFSTKTDIWDHADLAKRIGRLDDFAKKERILALLKERIGDLFPPSNPAAENAMPWESFVDLLIQREQNRLASRNLFFPGNLRHDESLQAQDVMDFLMPVIISHSGDDCEDKTRPPGVSALADWLVSKPSLEARGVLLAEAGMGKSVTLALTYIELLKRCRNDCDSVFPLFVEARQLEVLKIQSGRELAFSLTTARSALLGIDTSSYENELGRRKIILLVDALDERSTDGQIASVPRVLGSSDLSFLIACRPADFIEPAFGTTLRVWRLSTMDGVDAFPEFASRWLRYSQQQQVDGSVFKERISRFVNEPVTTSLIQNPLFASVLLRIVIRGEATNSISCRPRLILEMLNNIVADALKIAVSEAHAVVEQLAMIAFKTFKGERWTIDGLSIKSSLTETSDVKKLGKLFSAEGGRYVISHQIFAEVLVAKGIEQTVRQDSRESEKHATRVLTQWLEQYCDANRILHRGWHQVWIFLAEMVDDPQPIIGHLDRCHKRLNDIWGTVDCLAAHCLSATERGWQMQSARRIISRITTRYWSRSLGIETPTPHTLIEHAVEELASVKYTAPLRNAPDKHAMSVVHAAFGDKTLEDQRRHLNEQANAILNRFGLTDDKDESEASADDSMRVRDWLGLILWAVGMSYIVGFLFFSSVGGLLGWWNASEPGLAGYIWMFCILFFWIAGMGIGILQSIVERHRRRMSPRVKGLSGVSMRFNSRRASWHFDLLVFSAPFVVLPFVCSLIFTIQDGLKMGLSIGAITSGFLFLGSGWIRPYGVLSLDGTRWSQRFVWWRWRRTVISSPLVGPLSQRDLERYQSIAEDLEQNRDWDRRRKACERLLSMIQECDSSRAEFPPVCAVPFLIGAYRQPRPKYIYMDDVRYMSSEDLSNPSRWMLEDEYLLDEHNRHGGYASIQSAVANCLYQISVRGPFLISESGECYRLESPSQLGSIE